MIHLRKYATASDFNADQTRVYPTVSYIVENGGDVQYETSAQSQAQAPAPDPSTAR